MAHPPVVIVDASDNVVGEMMLRDVWKTGAYHRIVRVLVVDKHGRILLQRRAAHMELFPDCWDTSAAGHVDEGMKYLTAARQELIEELSLAEGELQEIAYYQTNEMYKGRKLNRFNKLYRLSWNYTPELFPPDEVSEVRWFTKDEILELVDKRPHRASDGLLQSIGFIGEKTQLEQLVP